jgi:hypothetical protein
MKEIRTLRLSVLHLSKIIMMVSVVSLSVGTSLVFACRRLMLIATS